jgi:hypothetical protein
MSPQDSTERQKFENELNRIIQASTGAGVTLRVIGSLAFGLPQVAFAGGDGRCTPTSTLLGIRESAIRRDLMAGLGYAENREVTVVSEGMRMIFDSTSSGLHIDVFYDKLDFCHEISWKNGRLGHDSPTLPLAELLLEKMQIVKINEKDIIDTIMLMLEHPLGDDDKETINIKLVASRAPTIGARSTTNMNLGKVSQLVRLQPAERARKTHASQSGRHAAAQRPASLTCGARPCRRPRMVQGRRLRSDRPRVAYRLSRFARIGICDRASVSDSHMRMRKAIRAI